jgi:hypothetical protein
MPINSRVAVKTTHSYPGRAGDRTASRSVEAATGSFGGQVATSTMDARGTGCPASRETALRSARRDSTRERGCRRALAQPGGDDPLVPLQQQQVRGERGNARAVVPGEDATDERLRVAAARRPGDRVRRRKRGGSKVVVIALRCQHGQPSVAFRMARL